ncbi:MAG TPA: extracellular solute-binding protein [Bacillota bacterium]
MFIWAGAHQGDVPREVVAEYLEEHDNVEIELVEGSNAQMYPQMVAAKQATPDEPLIHFGFFNVSTVYQGIADDMWEPLNPERIPNLANTFEQYVPPDNMAAPFGMSTMGLMYNSDLVTDPPTSWSALWDPAYRGEVVAFDYQWQPLIVAARLNGGSEHDIDPGFEVWSENAANFKALVSTNDALQNLIVSGDATLAMWFASIWKIWADEGAPLGFVTPEEGPVAFPTYLTIVKGVTDEQRRVAEDIINLLLEPKNAGRYAELTYSVPLVKDAEVSDAVRNDPNFSPLLAERAMQLDWAAMAQYNAEWRERWDREVKANID